MWEYSDYNIIYQIPSVRRKMLVEGINHNSARTSSIIKQLFLRETAIVTSR